MKECHLIVYTNTLGGQLMVGVDHIVRADRLVVGALVVLALVVGAVFSSPLPEECKKLLGFEAFQPLKPHVV